MSFCRSGFIYKDISFTFLTQMEIKIQRKHDYFNGNKEIEI